MQSKWKNQSGTRTYFAWRNMRARCLNENERGYRHYGGRGIYVCERWVNDYDAFFEDMGECKENLTLDRIDSNGNYELSNCRWATMKEQQNNRRNNKLITYKSRTMTVSQWANELDLGLTTLLRRLYVAKMPIDKAFTTVLRQDRPKRIYKKSERILKKDTHGTFSYYNLHKCQCYPCLKARDEVYKDAYKKQKERMEKKKISKDFNHGTRYGYDMGCRCLACTSQNRLRSERYRDKVTLRKELIDR